MSLVLVLVVILLALVFDFINGFHDSANSIATVVSTRVLSPTQAILMAASLDFAGALVSVEVAKTIGGGIVDAGVITQTVVVSAIVGAIVWNLITWYYGLPSSSSHALIGGLVGVVLVSNGAGALKWAGLRNKVLIPLVGSPLIGFTVGFLVMLSLLWIFQHASPQRVNNGFRRAQLVSSAFMALSHGTNDAQKSMGIITLALAVEAKTRHWGASAFLPGTDLHPPLWVIMACAAAMAMGTASGGWRIIKTMGSKIIKLQPIHGFAAESSASLVLMVGAMKFGMPVSTTHVIAASIMGVGATKRLSAVRWGVAGNIVAAWILTIPAAATMGALTYSVLSRFLMP